MRPSWPRQEQPSVGYHAAIPGCGRSDRSHAEVTLATLRVSGAALRAGGYHLVLENHFQVRGNRRIRIDVAIACGRFWRLKLAR
jgi:hypothetical protein